MWVASLDFVQPPASTPFNVQRFHIAHIARNSTVPLSQLERGSDLTYIRPDQPPTSSKGTLKKNTKTAFGKESTVAKAVRGGSRPGRPWPEPEPEGVPVQ